jgi:hypothetical protein
MAQAFVVPITRHSHRNASARSSLKAAFFTDDYIETVLKIENRDDLSSMEVSGSTLFDSTASGLFEALPTSASR